MTDKESDDILGDLRSQELPKKEMKRLEAELEKYRRMGRFSNFIVFCQRKLLPYFFVAGVVVGGIMGAYITSRILKKAGHVSTITYSNLYEEKEVVDKELEDANVKIEGLESTVDDYSGQINAATDELSHLTDRKTELERMLTDARYESDQLKNDVDELLQAKETLAKEKSDYLNKTNSLQKGLDTLQRQHEDSQALGDKLREELSDAKYDITDLNKRLEETTQERNQLAVDYDKLATSYEEIKAKSKKQKKILDLEDVIEEDEPETGPDETKTEEKPKSKIDELGRRIKTIREKESSIDKDPTSYTPRRTDNTFSRRKRSYHEHDWFSDALLLSSDPDLPLSGFDFFCSVGRGEKYPDVNGAVQLSFRREDSDYIITFPLFAECKEILLKKAYKDENVRIVEQRYGAAMSPEIGLGKESYLNIDFFYSYKKKSYNDVDETFLVKHTGDTVCMSFGIGFKSKAIGLKLYASGEVGSGTNAVTRIPDSFASGHYFFDNQTYSLMQSFTSNMHVGICYERTRETFRQNRTGTYADWSARTDKKHTRVYLALTDITDITLLRNIILEFTHKEGSDQLIGMLSEPVNEYKLKLIEGGVPNLSSWMVLADEKHQPRLYYGLEVGWEDPDKGGKGMFGGIFFGFNFW